MDEPRAKQEVEKQGQPDAFVLYRSLVWEGVLPEGFDREFQEFYSPVSPAAERQRQNSAHCDNVAAAGWLSEHKRQAEVREKARLREPTLAGVVAATTGRVPKTFKSRLQRALYDTPSARQEAEEGERLRWLQALALLVERSPTPMGNLLARQPGSIALLDAGRRAATLRNRIRLLRNYFSWLTATHEVLYPISPEHFVGFLRARASEPVNRGALRNVNRTFTFLHEVTETEQANRLTATPLYDAVYREILTSCEPGRPVKQPPRFPVGLLAVVENFVTTDSSLHADVWLVGPSAELGHDAFLRPPWLVPSRHHSQRWKSNTALEEDEDQRHRQERVCETSESGRKFIHLFAPVALSRLADPQRAGPIPKRLSPSSPSWSIRQLSADGAQVRPGLRHSESSVGELGRQHKGAKVLTAEATLFWTPRSGRSFLPSCTAALGFPKEERDNLGGWSPQGSDTQARTAKLRISSM